MAGDPQVPVLTLHNLGDLLVPVLNPVEYAKRVQANGKSDLLVQRAIRGVLHCDFTPAGFSGAFLDPNEVANPLFGCNFTNGPHLLATACP